ncbi:MAG: GGDEF domain-containing protein [Gammaproteobacteria bacterium]
MDDIILQSVIKITRQPDIDSLEVSLITTLAEFIPAHAIFIVKPSDDSGPAEYLEVMRLSVSGSQGGQNQYEWTHDNAVGNGGHFLQECFTTKKPVHYQAEDGLERFLFPIIHNNSTDAVLGVEANQDLLSWRAIIEAFVKIYSNYLTILHISERDKLTDLYNRRTFDYKLDKLLKTQRLQYERYEKSPEAHEKRHVHPDMHSWLAITDIDHFKRINDNFGHLFGDEVILIVAQQMKRYFRRSDLLFRFGGEEFVIILEPLSPEKAHELLERFRAAIAAYKIPQVRETTVSIGYTRIIDGVSSHIILDHADKALYFAKNHGRNCLFSYEELVENGSLSEPRKANVTLFFDDAPDAT